LLHEREAELFLAMSRYDLAHSMAVAEKLRGDPLLFKAALLHDVGKMKEHLTLSTRWLYTCMELCASARLKRMVRELEGKTSGGDVLERALSLPKGWRRGFFVQVYHGELGAELLKGLGSEPEMVNLVKGHQKDPSGEKAERLKEIDDLY